MPGHTSGHGGKAGVGGQSPGPQGQRGGFGGGSGGGGFTGGGGGSRQPGLFGSLAASGTKEQIQAALKNPGIGKRLREELEGRLGRLDLEERLAKQKADAAAAKLAAEAAEARAEFNRLAAERRREEARIRDLQLETEKKEKEERQARLQKEQEEEAAARKAKADAEAAAKAAKEREADALRKQQLDYLSNPAVQDALKDLPRRVTPVEKQVRSQALLGGLGMLTPQEEDNLTPQSLARLSRIDLSSSQERALQDYAKEQGLDVDNFVFTPGEGPFGLKQQPLIRDITTGEIIGRPSEGMTGPLGAGLAALGIDTSGISFPTDPTADRGGRQDDRQATSTSSRFGNLLKKEEEPKEEEQEVLSGFTGAARGSSPQFISSLPVSGITRLPAATNYMDYLRSAFTPVNLASPFGGAFSSNPVYRAAHGGFIGFMDEPLNIMYPSNGNMVVHDGISSILKKYKEIRSEL